jgi:hypothetical protein
MAGYLAVYEVAIGGHFLAHLIGGDHEEALEAVVLLELEGCALLTGEEGLARPGGAPVDAGGVGGGGHGGDVLVPLGDGDVLGFVAFEEVGGGGSDHDPIIVYVGVDKLTYLPIMSK